MDFMLALSAANQALGLVKDLREIDRGLSQGELKAAMAEIYGNLADVKVALADARQEMQAKEDEIQRLKGALAFKEDLVRVGSHKYRKGPDGQPRGAPFCTVCEAKHHLFIPVSRGLTVNQVSCPNCKGYFDARTKFYPDE